MARAGAQVLRYPPILLFLTLAGLDPAVQWRASASHAESRTDAESFAAPTRGGWVGTSSPPMVNVFGTGALA
jgi:hypothetical protein